MVVSAGLVFVDVHPRWQREGLAGVFSPLPTHLHQPQVWQQCPSLQLRRSKRCNHVTGGPCLTDQSMAQRGRNRTSLASPIVYDPPLLQVGRSQPMIRTANLYERLTVRLRNSAGGSKVLKQTICCCDVPNDSLFLTGLSSVTTTF